MKNLINKLINTTKNISAGTAITSMTANVATVAAGFVYQDNPEMMNLVIPTYLGTVGLTTITSWAANLLSFTERFREDYLIGRYN